MRISGNNLNQLLKESGGHRYQGYSKGRVHTSTITVAVVQEQNIDIDFHKRDVEIVRTKSQGNGGQNVNSRSTKIVATHKPTGIQAIASDRKQGQNLQKAMEELELRVKNKKINSFEEQINKERKRLIGSGGRGDKIRTYRERDNIIIDHRTDAKMPYTEILKGNLP